MHLYIVGFAEVQVSLAAEAERQSAKEINLVLIRKASLPLHMELSCF